MLAILAGFVPHGNGAQNTVPASVMLAIIVTLFSVEEVVLI